MPGKKLVDGTLSDQIISNCIIQVRLKYLVHRHRHLKAGLLIVGLSTSHVVEKWKICLPVCTFWYFNVVYTLSIMNVEILWDLVKSWWRNLD